ncbi:MULTISPECIES: putative protein N(5)-glutamine methyltransferase [Streptacidiphilus]|uniref:peptide chain release factor N(5)-glutamine methyltransferase n=1 Tax=Streptacidiphilus cavernicola TaxID=3342716 RepID=A0ABV6UHM7_9ACTN|nr:putative protein N(5)-glutamine methyltransferase [Streptacidiphilus jeojiense]
MSFPVLPSSPAAPADGLDAVVSRLRAAGCVFAEDEAALLVAAATTPAELDSMVRRRAAGLPLEHILGWAGFCGLRVAVDPQVFVPRVRTEFLVRQAAALAPPDAVVVDLCCGTGAVGLALLADLAAAGTPAAELHAADIDPASVRCARRNLTAPGRGAPDCGAMSIAVHQGDLYDPLPERLRGRVDLLVVNAPYVPTEAIALLPTEARVHEARVALDGGPDGLDLHRRVAAGADRWLAPGGSLLIETSERQAEQTAAVFAAGGLLSRITGSDELDATVVIGTRP